MSIDARNEQFELVELFGKPALYTDLRVARDTIPEGLHCYDLRGSDYDPGRPSTVEPQVMVNHAGTVIMAEPVDFKGKDYRSVKGKLNFLDDAATLEEFIAKHGHGVSQQKTKYELHAAAENEAALFFSGQGDDDIRLGCIGHFRCDFGHQGKEFWHTWFDHVAGLKTPAFKEELQSLIDELRANGPLKDLDAMAEWCHTHGDAKLGDQYHRDAYGFKTATEAHSYYIRCFPQQGDYNAYIYCYDKKQQQMGKDEKEPAMDCGMSQQM